MANRLKGEAELKVKDKTYIVRLNFNVIIDIEDQLGLPIIEVFETIRAGATGKGVMKTVRTVIWCMLRDAQKDITQEQAGALIWEASMNHVLDVITEAANSAMPAIAGGTEGNGEAGPASP